MYTVHRASALHVCTGENSLLFSDWGEGWSVPDVAQTAALLKALHSIQTLPQGPQTEHTVLTTSTNTALFNLARLIQSNTFSMIHSVFTQSPEQDGCLESDMSLGLYSFVLLLCEGLIMTSGRPCGQQDETLAEIHTVPSPQTMACLSCPLSWLSSCLPASQLRERHLWEPNQTQRLIWSHAGTEFSLFMFCMGCLFSHLRTHLIWCME